MAQGNTDIARTAFNIPPVCNTGRGPGPRQDQATCCTSKLAKDPAQYILHLRLEPIPRLDMPIGTVHSQLCLLQKPVLLLELQQDGLAPPHKRHFRTPCIIIHTPNSNNLLFTCLSTTVPDVAGHIKWPTYQLLVQPKHESELQTLLLLINPCVIVLTQNGAFWCFLVQVTPPPGLCPPVFAQPCLPPPACSKIRSYYACCHSQSLLHLL